MSFLYWLVGLMLVVWCLIFIYSFIKKPSALKLFQSLGSDALVNPKVNLGKVSAVHSIQGQRSHMEDSYYADYHRAFFAVYDGHGGSRASQFASKHLHDLIFAHLPSSSLPTPSPALLSLANNSSGTSPSSALTAGFLDLDRQWLDLASVNGWDDGSTAIAVLIINNTLYVANVGDSRAVLVSSGQAIDMSLDQKPNRADEKDRIEQLGGRIIHYGTWRVEGVLAVTRAIGDRRLKKYVTATPEIRIRQLVPSDQFLILATDGVWDVLSSQQAADIVASTSIGDVRAAAIAVTNTAYQRNSQDNITTMVIDLRHYYKQP